MGAWSAPCLLMPWCQSTRPSVSTVVIKYTLYWTSFMQIYIYIYNSLKYNQSHFDKIKNKFLVVYMLMINELAATPELVLTVGLIARFLGPTWDPPGSCRPQMGPMLAPWTLLSGCFDMAGGLPGPLRWHRMNIIVWNSIQSWVTTQPIQLTYDNQGSL